MECGRRGGGEWAECGQRGVETERGWRGGGEWVECGKRGVETESRLRVNSVSKNNNDVIAIASHLQDNLVVILQ